MAETKLGCACDSFQVALRDRFVSIRNDKAYLADQESQAMGGWSVLYGPEITHCPFCGSKLKLTAS